MTIAEGTVYPLLRRLVKSGELSTYYQPSTEGPSRKYYQLTQQGLRVDQLGGMEIVYGSCRTFH